MKPVRLPANQPQRFYRGGAAIARFRGAPPGDDHVPEDWVGSTTAIFASEPLGLTTLPDGRLLRDAVTAEAERFLGPEHIAAFGPDPAVLVKRRPPHAGSDEAISISIRGVGSSR